MARKDEEGEAEGEAEGGSRRYDETPAPVRAADAKDSRLPLSQGCTVGHGWDRTSEVLHPRRLMAWMVFVP